MYFEKIYFTCKEVIISLYVCESVGTLKKACPLLRILSKNEYRLDMYENIRSHLINIYLINDKNKLYPTQASERVHNIPRYQS